MRLKDKTQKIIQFIGFAGLLLGIVTMLRIPTVILPHWFLVALFFPILLLVSFLVGIAVKYLTKSTWSRLTFTSMLVGLFCIGFYISEYRPTYTITVTDNFSGQVKIFLSKERADDFELNEYGIGYVSEKTYRNGFKPKVVKNGMNITSGIKNLTYGSQVHAADDGKVIGTYKFLSFTVPGQPTDSLSSNLIGLLNKNAIDTTRLLKY